MSATVETKWLNFVFTGNTPSGKTKTYDVQNKSGMLLGLILWYPGWRRYTFCPMTGMTFDADCLAAITKFITDLMEERKQKFIQNLTDPNL